MAFHFDRPGALRIDSAQCAPMGEDHHVPTALDANAFVVESIAMLVRIPTRANNDMERTRRDALESVVNRPDTIAREQ